MKIEFWIWAVFGVMIGIEISELLKHARPTPIVLQTSGTPGNNHNLLGDE